MILVRNTFQLKFGKAKDAKAMMQDGLKIAAEAGLSNNRAYLDITGPFYTLVFENSFESLAEFESAVPVIMKHEKWQKWYGSFMQLVESGHREIYSIIE